MSLPMQDAPGHVVTGEMILAELTAGDQHLGQGDARDLRDDRLVVHQRQVEEQGLQVGDVGVPVELAGDRRHRHPARLRV